MTCYSDLMPGAWLSNIDPAGETVVSVIDALQDEADDWCVGPQKAFFELPHGCVTYTTYAFTADTAWEALTAIKYVVLHAMRNAGEGRARYDDSVMLANGRQGEQRADGRWRVRTRLAIVKARRA